MQFGIFDRYFFDCRLAKDKKIKYHLKKQGKKNPKRQELEFGIYCNVLRSREHFYPLREAARYSRFIRAIFSREIPFGHSTSQAPVFVQFPKPSSSI